MKVLIVGSGGREHAIAWSVAKSPKVDKIYCAPGNAGIAEFAECVNIKAMEFDKLVAFAKENAIDLTIIGMDDPLVGGLVDTLEEAGIRTFGPKKNAAILGGSKAFSKDLMKLQKYLYDVTDVKPYIYRFPGGSSNHCAGDIKPYIRYVNKKGLLYFDWNALNEDAVNFEQTSKQLNDKILKDVRRQKTSIVLMHDLHETKNTVKGLDTLIKTLKKEGYLILPITKNTKPLHHVSIDK